MRVYCKLDGKELPLEYIGIDTGRCISALFASLGSH